MKNQKASNNFRIGFALSKTPCKRRAIAVPTMKLLQKCYSLAFTIMDFLLLTLFWEGSPIMLLLYYWVREGH